MFQQFFFFSFFFLIYHPNKAVKNDGGVYWCEAKNELGVVRSRNATLQVAGESLTFSILIIYRNFWHNSLIYADFLTTHMRVGAEAKRGRNIFHAPLPLINSIKHIHFEYQNIDKVTLGWGSF